MDDTTKIALASAVAGGYLLGRTKKGRVALTLALMLAGRGVSAQPRQLAGEAAQWLGEVPQVAQLKDQLRDEGTDAARKVMTSLTERGVGSLADAISSRTPGSVEVPGDAASQSGEQPEAEQEREDDDQSGAEEDQEYEAEAEDEEEGDSADEEPTESAEGTGEEEPKPHGMRGKPARKTAPARASSTTKKTATSAPAKKAAAKKTATKKTGSANRSSRRR